MATKVITVNFTQNGVPVLGLTPTIDIWQVNPDVQVVTAGALVEIAQGWYRYNFTSYDYSKSYIFTIDGGAILSACDRYKIGANESYEEDISYEVWEENSVSHTTPGSTGLYLNQIKADTTTITISVATITTIVNTLLKFEQNRTRIDTVTSQLIIYDNDCVTPLYTFNLRDHLGNPSVQEVCERSPTPECP